MQFLSMFPSGVEIDRSILSLGEYQPGPTFQLTVDRLDGLELRRRSGQRHGGSLRKLLLGTREPCAGSPGGWRLLMRDLRRLVLPGDGDLHPANQ